MRIYRISTQNRLESHDIKQNPSKPHKIPGSLLPHAAAAIVKALHILWYRILRSYWTTRRIPEDSTSLYFILQFQNIMEFDEVSCNLLLPWTCTTYLQFISD